MNKGEGFPKAGRLRNRRDYLKVQHRGAKVTADLLLAVALPNGAAGEDAPTRVGFTVSTKVGNAVVRNRVRRSLRELYRKNKGSFPKGIDVVLIAKPNAAAADREALARAFFGLADRLRARFGSGAAL